MNPQQNNNTPQVPLIQTPIMSQNSVPVVPQNNTQNAVPAVPQYNGQQNSAPVVQHSFVPQELQQQFNDYQEQVQVDELEKIIYPVVEQLHDNLITNTRASVRRAGMAVLKKLNVRKCQFIYARGDQCQSLANHHQKKYCTKHVQRAKQNEKMDQLNHYYMENQRTLLRDTVNGIYDQMGRDRMDDVD